MPKESETQRSPHTRLSWMLLVMVVALTTGVVIAPATLETTGLQQVAAAADRTASGKRLPSLTGATGWLNSPALTRDELRGKVVLIDFWTYSCINWIRTLPYTRAWAAKYKDKGLVIIGVHTPEFEFEKSTDNIRRAVTDMQVDYPVAVDSNYSIWNAFGNQYWPAVYIVDGQGRIRHQQFGEGGYEDIERVIQTLLIQSGASDVSRDLVRVKPVGIEAPAEFQDVKSPETYVGYARSAAFASPGGMSKGTSRFYRLPPRLDLNQWAFSGEWGIGAQSARLLKPDGKLAFRFHARDLNLVMGSVVPGGSVRFRVFINGQPAKAVQGVDVDDEGYGVVREHRLYQLVRQPKPINDQDFQIEFLDANVEAYVFTFG